MKKKSHQILANLEKSRFYKWPNCLRGSHDQDKEVFKSYTKGYLSHTIRVINKQICAALKIMTNK